MFYPMVKPRFLTVKDPEVISFFGKENAAAKDDESGFALLLEKDGVPFAGAIYFSLDPERYELTYILVDENLRQKSLASLAIRFVEERIREVGGRYLYVAPPLFLHDHFADEGYVFSYPPDNSRKKGPYLFKFLEADFRPYLIGGKRS